MILSVCSFLSALSLSASLHVSLPSSSGSSMSSKTPTNPSNLVMKKFYIETHGCQMNLADSDIVRSILLTEGYEMSDDLETADLILANTCAIRENAEDKIWQRLKYFQSIRKKSYLNGFKPKGYPLIGVLGCMAERLKSRLIQEEGVDFVAGPDAYRSLSTLLKSSSTDPASANTLLSLDETYADIPPVRLAEGNTHAFVTITRGCDNHCAFCIVPYTRGRERSLPVNTILAEVQNLRDQGFKEVVLLGQNVNSYWDTTTCSERAYHDREHALADGFHTRKQPRPVSAAEGGVRFEELLARVAAIDPEMRVRFQSPHPKDFGDDLLRLIANTPNICNSLHMPSQHGSSTALERMKRGYSREAYVALVERARAIIGAGAENGLGLSTDMIAGFCGETEEEHRDSVRLLLEVGFDQAFTYAYSRREQTFAGLFYKDDVKDEDKSRRLQELIDAFQSTAAERNTRIETGRLHVVLVEGNGKKSREGSLTWTGRTDTNKRVVFRDSPVLTSLTAAQATLFRRMGTDAGCDVEKVRQAVEDAVTLGGGNAAVRKGDYVVIKVLSCRGHTLRGAGVALTSLTESYQMALSRL